MGCEASKPSSSKHSKRSGRSKSRSGHKSRSKHRSGHRSRHRSRSSRPSEILDAEALRALRMDFLGKLNNPHFNPERHRIWTKLTPQEQDRCKRLQTSFESISEDELLLFIESWRREHPEDMDYGYNPEDDTLYPQEAEPPTNALGIFHAALERSKAKEPAAPQSTGQAADFDAILENIERETRPVSLPVPGTVPEDYAEIREELRSGGDLSAKPPATKPSASESSSSKPVSSKHSSSKHSSSKRSSSKGGSHHKSSSSRRGRSKERRERK